MGHVGRDVGRESGRATAVVFLAGLLLGAGLVVVGSRFVDLSTDEPTGGVREATASPAADATPYADASLWEMDCTGAVDPSTVEVRDVVPDPGGDSAADLVVATCGWATGAGSDELSSFPADGSPAQTLVGATATSRVLVDSVRVGSRLLVRGSAYAPEDSTCCPTLRFRQVFSRGDDGWTTEGMRSWPASQSRAVGYGAVELGMTTEELESSGAVVSGPSEGVAGCTSYTMASGGTVFLHEWGVVQIGFVGEMTTSAGIRIGSTAAEVRAAYPDAVREPYYGAWQVRVTPEATYLIGLTGGRVTTLSLLDADSGCMT